MDAAKNSDPGAFHHVRLPECKMLKVPLMELPSCLTSWQSRKVSAVVDLCVLRTPPQPPTSETLSNGPDALGSSPTATPPAPLYISPCDNGRLWSPRLKAALLPVCDWLEGILLIPAARLAALSAKASALIRSPEEEFKGSEMEEGADFRPLPVPFTAALVQLEWTSCGSVLPLKYETTGRILVQV